MSTLTPTIHDDEQGMKIRSVENVLNLHHIPHGVLTPGRRWLHENMSDEENVFIKIRTGQPVSVDRITGIDAFANEIVGALHANSHHIPASEPLLPHVVTLETPTRDATVWKYMDDYPVPSDTTAFQKMGELVAATAATPPPANVGTFKSEQIIKRLGWRLAGSTHKYAQQIAPLAFECERTLRHRLKPETFVWIHGDPHFDNVRWKVDGSPVLIDWESHCVGPIEWDIAQLRRINTDTPTGDAEAAHTLDHNAIQTIMDGRPVDENLLILCTLLRSLSYASHLILTGLNPHILEQEIGIINRLRHPFQRVVCQ